MQPPHPTVSSRSDPCADQLDLLDRLFRCTVDLCRAQRMPAGGSVVVDRVITELDTLIRQVRSGEIAVKTTQSRREGSCGTPVTGTTVEATPGGL